MTPAQAKALLALIADLYTLASEPTIPPPPPVPNGVDAVQKPKVRT